MSSKLSGHIHCSSYHSLETSTTPEAEQNSTRCPEIFLDRDIERVRENNLHRSWRQTSLQSSLRIICHLQRTGTIWVRDQTLSQADCWIWILLLVLSRRFHFESTTEIASHVKEDKCLLEFFVCQTQWSLVFCPLLRHMRAKHKLKELRPHVRKYNWELRPLKNSSSNASPVIPRHPTDERMSLHASANA